MQSGFSGPLYQQVHELLRGRITSGEWRSGTPIPGEADLSRELGVSIGTVRKALDKLARDRVVFRERGRGTFVKDGASWSSNAGFRFCDEHGVAADAEIAAVDIATQRASPQDINALRLPRRAVLASNVLKLTREWRRDGVLLCLEVLTLDADRFQGLAQEDHLEDETLFDLYAEKYRAKVDRSTWTLKPLAHDDPRAAALEAGRDTPMLSCRRIALDAKDAPIEICDQVLRCDREAFQLTR